MKIRTKIFAVTMLVVIFLLVSLTYIMSTYSARIILRKTEKDVGYSVSQTSQNIDQLLQSYEQVIDTLYTDTSMQERLLAPYGTFISAYDSYSEYILPYLNWIRASKDIKRVTIYTDNPTLQFGDVKPIDSDTLEYDWYQYMQQPFGEKLVKRWLPGAEDFVFNRGSVRLVQQIYNDLYNSYIYVVVELDERLLYNLVSRESKDRQYLAVLPDGRLLFDSFNRNKNNLRIESYDFYNELKLSEPTSVYIERQGAKFLLTSHILTSRKSLEGVRVIALTPTSELTTSVNEMKHIAIWLLLGSILISVVLLYIISNQLTKRLMRLARKMRNVNLSEQINPHDVDGSDEISQLARVFHKMIERIQLLIEEVYNSEIHRKDLELRKKESELYALQMQINPHYLFNTLNALYGNLLENKDQENAEIVKLLAQSFRNILGKGGALIHLNDEIKMIEVYLRIQAFRYGSRLHYEFAIPENLYSVKIPRLSLQTLVENSIVHALEVNEYETHITIGAEWNHPDGYMIYVKDNGPGISEQQLQDVLQRIHAVKQTDNNTKQIGLRNIHQQLIAIFGSSSGLILESTPGEGTKAAMLLPVSYIFEEENDEKCTDC